MTIAPDTIDWTSWLHRWDAQQTGYIPEREERFTAMLDVLEAVLPPAFVALDLACGPGAISQRLLARFPQARCVAVDIDPVLLALGQGALGTLGGRLRWVDADLRNPAWIDQLDEPLFDAVLSTTALHWLRAGDLARVYDQLGQRVRPGGVVLNGDHMPYAHALPTLRQLAARAAERISADSFGRRGGEDWKGWWDALAAEPALAPLLAERARRFPDAAHDEQAPSVDLHAGALRSAGFREVGVIWQRFDDRVLLAVR